jgi:protein TonB
MTDSLFAWAVVASLGTHLVGLAAASALGSAQDATAAPASSVPIEVVRVEPDAPPPPPPREPPLRKLLRLAPRPPRQREVIENRLMAPTLMDDSTPREPQVPAPVASPDRRLLAASSVVPRAGDAVGAPREGGEAGAGRLFAVGDIAVQPGRGTAGGSGAQGRGGTGLASRGTGSQAEAGGAGGGALTSLARLLGGYQHMPAYPEGARRQGAEGVATLRFQVQADGTVGEMAVVRSAGHPELDGAAMEAVKKWRFEPARSGREAVAVWVTLPVRFELKAQ